MLLTVSYNAATTPPADEPLTSGGKINLTELRELRRDHLPGPLVKCAALPELERRAAEIRRELPHYGEEVAFVLHEERYRRFRLAGSPLRLAS